MEYDTKNVFARILRGEIPSRKVYEDDFCLAFEDIHPKAKVHIVVIPKGAYVDFDDFALRASESEVSGFFRGVSASASAAGIEAGGYRLVSNKGVMGGQEVPHFHVHLLGGEKLGPLLPH